MPDAPPPPTPPPLWRVFANVEGGVVLAAAAATAFATSLPVIAGLGVAAWGILAANRYAQFRHARAVESERVPQPSTDGLDARYGIAMLEGWRAAQAVLDQVTAAGSDAQSYFAEASVRVRDLSAKHAALVRRAQDVGRFVDSVDVRALTRERDALRARAEKTADAPARAQFAAAAKALDETLAAREELVRDADRIEAQLAAIRAAFESTRAKIARVSAVEAREAAGEGEAVADALTSLSTDVDTLSRAVDEVYLRGTNTQPKELP